MKVDTRIQLCGFGLYGSNTRGGTLNLKTAVYGEGEESLSGPTSTFLKSNGSCHPVKFLFSNPITLEANKKYFITANIIGGQTYYGVNFSPDVLCNDPMPFKVALLGSMYTTDSGTYTEGQFPSLYFSK